jgi:hypothetical protein
MTDRARTAGSQGKAWSLCYSSFHNCTSCPSASFDENGHKCSCSISATTFHGGCDGHTTTLVLGHNSLGCAVPP